MAAMVSCSMEQEPATVETNKVSATADDFKCDEAFTRTTITQSGSSAPTFAWKEGDVIGVIPMDGKTVQSNYEISKIDSDPKTATFDGGVWALKDGKSYAAYYPMQPEFVMSGDKLEFSFTGQTQTANNSLEHIGAYDYMYAPAVTVSSSATEFNFSHLISLVRLQITVPQADTYTKLVLESTESWFAGAAELTLTDGTTTAKESLKSAAISLDNIEVAAGGVLTVWLAMLPTDVLESKALNVRLYGTNALVTGELTGLKTFEAGKAYSFSCTPSSSPLSEMEYVDLGLSVKWATCNLGATSIDGYGDYYAWGELEPKEEYSTGTYKYYNKVHHDAEYVPAEYDKDGFLVKEAYTKEAYDETGYTKYVPQSKAGDYGFQGFYDDLTTLDLEDDVAHVKLGGKWRMPTSSEIDELISNCTWTWTTYKTGVKGYKVTSKKTGYTDKWIFLPAAGYRRGTYLGDVGSLGYYWSSSLNASYPYCACGLYFILSSVSRDRSGRYFGQSIRPVTE